VNPLFVLTLAKLTQATYALKISVTAREVPVSQNNTSLQVQGQKLS
jgi:hypothetical protein